MDSPGYNENFEAPSLQIEPYDSPGYNENFEGPSEETPESFEKEEENRTAFYNMVSLYYNYKHQYEMIKEKMRRRISASFEKRNTDKARQAYLKKKPECVNCGRNVGTIFQTEFRTMLTDEDFRRTLVAKCGDNVSPCNLDIQISMPYMLLFDDTIEPTKESINSYKKRIIQIKNEVMFGYMKEDDAIKRYTAIGDLLADDTKLLEETLAFRDKTTKQYQRRKQLEQAEELLERDVDEFIRLTKEYNVTRSDQLLKDSTMIYVGNISKTAKTITNAKYEYNEIEYNEDSNKFTLVQKEFPLNSQQNYSGEDIYETVIKFVKGDTLNKFNKTIKKSKVASIAIAKNKPKTRKQKTRDARIKQKLSGSSSNSSMSSSLSSSEPSSSESSVEVPSSSVETPVVNLETSSSE